MKSLLFTYQRRGLVLIWLLGGAAQVLVGQPLDTVKTRAQIAPSECQSAIGCTLLNVTDHFGRGYVCECINKLELYGPLILLQKGPMDILTQTIRKEGVFALWKGMCALLFVEFKGLRGSTLRYGEPLDWYSRRQLAPLHLLRGVKAYHLTIPRVVFERDRCCWCNGWCCQLRSS